MPIRLSLLRTLAALILTALLLAPAARAADWPQWRCDAARSATTTERLPDSLHLQWSRELIAPEPAWPASQAALRFD